MLLVRERQRELGIPEAFEWVHEVTPQLLGPARATGLVVGEHPLMVLTEPIGRVGSEVTLRLLSHDDEALAEVDAAISAVFNDTDEVGEPGAVDVLRLRIEAGTVRVVGAFDPNGAIGGGSHSPRGGVTELTGIAVVPRARQRGVGAAITTALVEDAHGLGVQTVFLSADDDRVAAIYSRVGFTRIATACIGETRGHASGHASGHD